MFKNYRQCVSCRKVAPKTDFWRVVRCYPDHEVALDHGMGRSVYLCPSAECLKLARKKDRLSRALKARVDIAVYHCLEKRLSQVAQVPMPDISDTSSDGDTLIIN